MLGHIFALLIEMHRYHPHLWNCLHNLMIPLPLKQNHAKEACMDTSFCSNTEELPDVYISSVERIFTADHAINFALHAWQGCSTDGNFHQYY